MFDRDLAVAEWRKELARAGTMFEADLDELESHLADELDGLEEVGITGEGAFRTATERLGETHALADEFAKVNPLLAWRAALFWITAGILLVVALIPFQQLCLHATLAGAFALHVPMRLIVALMWAVELGSPFLFFAWLFPAARRQVESPLPWARSPTARVTIVVLAAVLALSAHLGSDWGWLFSFERQAFGKQVLEAWDGARNAAYALAVVGPLVLAGLVLRHRAEAMRDRASGAPLFWLAIGLFIGAVRCELHDFVRSATLAGGGFAQLGAVQMHRLMWLVTLGSPAALIVSTLAYLKYGAPAPSRLLRARGLLVTMALSGVAAVAAVFATGAFTRRFYATLPLEVAVAGYEAWLVAGVVASCAVPVVVGSLMWRLRQAGSLAVVRGD